MIFYAKRVNGRTQNSEESLLRASLFKWCMEEEDLLAEMEYFSDLIFFGRCLSVPLRSLFRIHECSVLFCWKVPDSPMQEIYFVVYSFSQESG